MKKFTLKKLPSFSVVGIEGSSKDGPAVIQDLWNKAENHLNDVLPSLKRDPVFPVYWGLMSDFGHRLLPWENDFKDGLYLAGFELADDRLLPPEGWTKWVVPAQEYLVLAVGDDYQASFRNGLAILSREGYVLSGAVFDHMDQGKMFLYYPISAAS